MNSAESSGNWSEGTQCHICKRGPARLFTLVGLVFLLLFAFIFSVPNNMNPQNKPIILSICGGILLLCFVPGYHFSRWHFTIRDRTVFCRGMLGREKQLPVSELSGFTFGPEGELFLYKKDRKRFFVIDHPLDKYYATEALGNLNILYLRTAEECSGINAGECFVMKAGKSYKTVLCIMILTIAGILGGGALVIRHWPMLLLALAITAWTVLYACRVCSERITVSDAQIERTIFLGKTVTIPFSQVEKVEFSHENNTTYYCFYVDGQVALKIMKLYEESWRLGVLIEEKQWMEDDEEDMEEDMEEGE